MRVNIRVPWGITLEEMQRNPASRPVQEHAHEMGYEFQIPSAVLSQANGQLAHAKPVRFAKAAPDRDTAGWLTLER